MRKKQVAKFKRIKTGLSTAACSNRCAAPGTRRSMDIAPDPPSSRSRSEMGKTLRPLPDAFSDGFHRLLQSRACDPSQSGALSERLHPQKKTRPAFSVANLIGTKSVPLWLPSQNGCFALLPQAHQK
jgi:hypothetical protein